MPTLSALSQTPGVASTSASDLLDLRRRIDASVDSDVELLNGSAINQLLSEAVFALCGFSPSNKSPVDLAAACALVETVLRRGWVKVATDEDSIHRAEALVRENWSKQLAALLIVPAWQLSNLPEFSRAPLSLWQTLAVAYFQLPASFHSRDSAEGAAKVFSSRTAELLAAARSNPGSQAVRGAANACFEAKIAALRSYPVVLQKILKLQRELRVALSYRGKTPALTVTPRVDRKLRIGLVLPSLTDSRRTRLAISWFESLDERRFTRTIYFSGEQTPAISSSFAELGIPIDELTGSLEEQVSILAGGSPDCLIFAVPSVWPEPSTAQLLNHRISPVQMVIQEDGLPSTSVHADVTLTDLPIVDRRRLDGFSEEVVCVLGSGIRIPVSPSSRRAERGWNRNALDIHDDEVLLSSIAPFSLLSPEWASSVAKVLKSRPETKLLIYSHAEEDSTQAALSRLCSVLGPIMTEHGVAASRLIISNEPFEGLPEIEALLKMSDLHLDSFPATDREGALVALGSGCPVVTLRSSVGLASPGENALELLGLTECIAPSIHDFVQKVDFLVAQKGGREELRNRLSKGLAKADTYQNSTVFAECLASTIERLFDSAGESAGSPGLAVNLSVVDSPAIVAEATILLQSGLYEDALAKIRPIVACEPGNSSAIAVFFDSLIEAGHFSYVEPSLVAALARPEIPPGALSRLAKIRLKQGRRKDAMGLLKRHLDIFPRDVEAWMLMKDVTTGAGDTELAAQIDQVISELSGVEAVNQEKPTRGKSLYFSPVGKNGLEFFRKIRRVFPESAFDFLIIGYDEADFGELSQGIELIRDRGQKWRLIKKYLTPERVAGYEYVFMWDDDIDPCDFDALEFLEVLRRNELEVAQPSLTTDSFSFHPITVKSKCAIGRLTNFVEIMCPAYSAKTWPAIYNYIDPEINEFGWGYDLIPIGRKGIVDAMPVRHTRPGQSGKAGAEAQYFAWCKQYGIVRNPFISLKELK